MTSPFCQIGRVGVWVNWSSATAADELPAATRIEELGYGALWFAETPTSKEACVRATLLLGATQRIVVGTAIASIYARDPLALHAAAAAIGDAYPGRFVLGMGVSHRPLVEARGHDYARPVAAMRAYLDRLDEATGESFAAADPPPRLLAALGPRMLELARDRAAGAIPYLVTPEHTSRARDVLGDAPLLAPEQKILLEPDPSRARPIARAFVERYLKPEYSNYVNHLRALGYGDEDLAGSGSDRLVDALVAWGDEDAIVTRVREHLAAGADHVAVQIASPAPLGSAEQLRQTLEQLERLAPALLDA
jgi:probable F420-dependent oxidoreductase